MDDLLFNPEQSLGFMTITANRLLCAHMRRKMARAGIDLTAEQWGVLVHVWNQGDVSQEEMARFQCVEKSSMSRVLSGMEHKGLIRRDADPNDARRKIVRATAKGMEIKERSRGVAMEVLALALRDVDPQERAVCLKVLGAVKKTLQASGDR